MHAAVALVALALGYKVFADAHKEKEGLRLLGQIVGLVVMLAAVASMFCGMASCLSGGSQCHMMAKSGCPHAAKTVCPMGGASAEADK